MVEIQLASEARQERSNMIDQYGDKVPEDLVFLDNEFARIGNLEKIMELDWYESQIRTQGIIFVSYKALQSCIDGSFEGYSLEELGCGKLESVFYIAYALRRYGEIDNFYHV